MPRFRSAPLPQSFPGHPSRSAIGPIRVAPKAAPLVHRRLSREGAQALEILGHAIEYLADEYAVDTEGKGRLGSGDPRVEAIQVLKALNRAVYFSGTEIQPAWQRMRRWLLGWLAP